MAYGVALLLMKKENGKEIEVRYTEELRMDYRKLLDLYPFRAEYNGYMDYYLDISKEQLTDVYEQTKSDYYGSKKERLKESEKQQEYLTSILTQAGYDFIRIYIFEFNLY